MADPVFQTTDHLIGEDRDTRGLDGNMWTLTPTCSCGWRGYAVRDYEDDQWLRVVRQANLHLQRVCA